MNAPRVIETAVSEVEVFRSGAVVARTGELTLGEAGEELALDGLPLLVDDESVRLSFPGAPDCSPVDVRVELALPPPQASLVTPSDEEVLAAEDLVNGLFTRLARLDREESRLFRLQMRLPEPFANRPPRPAPAAAWRGLIGWAEERKSALLEERMALREELLRAQEALARVRRKAAEARAILDGRKDAIRKRIVFRVRGGAPGATAAVRAEYRVAGARWAPSYVFRLSRDGASARLAVRAVVTQRTGEAWNRVRLAVATADMRQETELPELRSLRIGRRAPEPPSLAWREPPEGLEVLFAGLDQALAEKPRPTSALPAPPPPPPLMPVYVEAPQGADAYPEAEAPEDGAVERTATYAVPSKSMKKRAMAPMAPARPAVMVPPAAPPMPAQAAMPMPASMAAPRGMMTLAGMGGMGFGAAGKPSASDDELSAEPEAEAEAVPPSFAVDASGLRYGDLALGSWDGTARGRLKPLSPTERLAGNDTALAALVASRLASEGARLSGLVLPRETPPVEESAGSFSYRYAAEGPVDVPSDGLQHSVPLLSRSAKVSLSLVAAPRESPQAVRSATLRNPLAVPLLAGPADIYLEDEFLVTSPIRTVPAGGELAVGLGVEERLKIARRVTFEEESRGMLGGGTALHHRVEIEVASRLPSAAEVEIRERVPTKGEQDKDVEIVVSEVSPAWTDFDQLPVELLRGGKRWRFTLNAGETRKLSFRYEVRIDSKNELVGGNRREPR